MKVLRLLPAVLLLAASAASALDDENQPSDPQLPSKICLEALEGTIIEATAVSVVTLPPPESALQTTERQAEFKKLTKLLIKQATEQEDIFVNSRRVSRFKLKGAEVYKTLRSFHLNPEVGHRGDRHRSIFIEANLDYQATQSAKDPKDKSKTIKAHSFKQQVSDKLTILAILIEEKTSKGRRLDRLLVRLLETDGERVSQVQIPLMYTHFGSYQALDGDLNLEDEGLKHGFNAELSLEGNPGQNKSAMVHATLVTSSLKPNPNRPLSLSVVVSR